MNEEEFINKKSRWTRVVVMKVKTKNEHKKTYKFLWILTFFLLFPFAILDIFNTLLEKIIDFVSSIRCNLVYKIMEFLFERGE